MWVSTAGAYVRARMWPRAWRVMWVPLCADKALGIKLYLKCAWTKREVETWSAGPPAGGPQPIPHCSPARQCSRPGAAPGGSGASFGAGW